MSREEFKAMLREIDSSIDEFKMTVNVYDEIIEELQVNHTANIVEFLQWFAAWTTQTGAIALYQKAKIF